jgi:hypothetical protein
MYSQTGLLSAEQIAMYPEKSPLCESIMCFFPELKRKSVLSLDWRYLKNSFRCLLDTPSEVSNFVFSHMFQDSHLAPHKAVTGQHVKNWAWFAPQKCPCADPRWTIQGTCECTSLLWPRFYLLLWVNGSDTIIIVKCDNKWSYTVNPKESEWYNTGPQKEVYFLSILMAKLGKKDELENYLSLSIWFSWDRCTLISLFQLLKSQHLAITQLVFVHTVSIFILALHVVLRDSGCLSW